MKYPKITVVTPSYNQGQFIEATILSVIEQEYPNLEYLVCDGGSTDETVEILKKFSDKITWWCSEKDKGQSDAINKGMRKATGDIVCWINSDDVLLPGHCIPSQSSIKTILTQILPMAIQSKWIKKEKLSTSLTS